MKALSVKAPWAGLITSGAKTIETRTRRTSYRGPLLVCETRPRGEAVCVVNVVDCRPMRPGDWAAACCDPYPNAFAWVLDGAEPVTPFAVRGMPGLFEVTVPPDRLPERYRTALPLPAGAGR